MIGKTNAITQAGGNDDMLVGLIERTLTQIKIPTSVTKIGNSVFANFSSLDEITIPNTVTTIEDGAFAGIQCEQIEIPSSVKTMGKQVISSSQVKTIILNEGLETIGTYCFYINSDLEKVNIPKSLQNIGTSPFYKCTNLIDVTIASGFNAKYLDLSPSTLYSVETIVSWFEALADRTGQQTHTLAIGATNLAKLTEEQIAIATAKNWTLA